MTVLKTQVGGNHYKNCKIQPIVFIKASNMNFSEGRVINYARRHGEKNGLEDLKKGRWYIDRLIETEYTNEQEAKADKQTYRP